MSKFSGQSNSQIFSSCIAMRNPAMCFLHKSRGVLWSLLVLSAFVMMTGQVRAAAMFSPLEQSEFSRVLQPPANRGETPSMRVAQMENTGNAWQDHAFKAIDIQKRLDALAREKKAQQARYAKRRRARKRRKVADRRRAKIRPAKRKSSLLKKASRRKVKRTRSKKLAKAKSKRLRSSRQKDSNEVVIVRKPVRLQRCLQQAGYFNGVITGRMDDATLLAYLTFREEKNLKHRPHNLYDPVIQKELFAHCPDDGLSNLNQIVAAAMGRKPTFSVSTTKPVAAKAPDEKKAAEGKKVSETVVAKAQSTTVTDVRKRERADEPLTTASIVVAKKQTRLPGLTTPVETAGKKGAPIKTVPAKIAVKKIAVKKIVAKKTAAQKTGSMPQVSTAGSEGAGEGSFAAEVLAATKAPASSFSVPGKKNQAGRRKIAQMSGSISSFPVKKSEAEKSVVAKKAAGSSAKKHRVASASSSPFSKRLNISDLAVAQPVNPNTCSPQNHKPALAMSTLPVTSSGQGSRSMHMARGYDDAPLYTGAVSASSFVRRGRQLRKNTNRLVPVSRPQKACLPQDLYDLLSTTHGRKTDVIVCKADCLPAPGSFSEGQKELFAEQHNINWCGAGCLGIAQPLPLREVMKIERDARVHVCTTPQLRLAPSARKGLDEAGINTQIRSLFDRLPGGYANENNIAVLIGNKNYGNRRDQNPAGHVNVAAMRALLVQQLGYRNENVIIVKDAKRKDFVRLFGERGNASGELQKRLQANPDAQLMIYYSGHASTSGLGMDNHLLPIDVVAGLERKTAFSMSVLYDNLRELDARTTQLFLETGFNADKTSRILAPNIAERRVIVAPIVPVRGLAVFSAARGDQKPLIDQETGIGLFTRYLISGLAGKADQRPIGNGDRIIDSVELYVHLASNIRLSARKTLGLQQNPTFARSDNLFLSQLSRKSRR